MKTTGKRFGLRAAVSCLAAIMPVFMATLAKAGAEPAFKEQLIGSLKDRNTEYNVGSVSSPAGCRVAWIKGPPQNMRVVLDGTALEVWDAIGKSVLLSEDGEHVCYAAKKAGQWCVVVDGKVGAMYPHIAEGYPKMSQDGKHVVYAADIGQGMIVIVHDAREVARYRYWGTEGPATEPAQPAGASGAAANKALTAARKALPLYDDGYGVSLSPNGQRLAYIVRKGSGYVIVIDGKESKPYKHMASFPVLFSPDGARWCHMTPEKGDSVCIVDGREFGPYERVCPKRFFSPDGKRWGGIAIKDGRHVMLLDGLEGTAYDEIYPGSPLFSPDSKRTVWVTRTKDKKALVLDGQAVSNFNSYSMECIKFSPDSRRLAYIGFRGKKLVAVCDGQESKEYDTIDAGSPVFSPNSKHVAWATETGGKWSILIDGKQGSTLYDEMTGVLFSPDSRHCAFLAKKGERWTLVLDDKELGACDQFICNAAFRPDGRLETIAQRGTDVYRMIVTPGP